MLSHKKAPDRECRHDGAPEEPLSGFVEATVFYEGMQSEEYTQGEPPFNRSKREWETEQVLGLEEVELMGIVFDLFLIVSHYYDNTS
jgi:hypothetical protein